MKKIFSLLVLCAAVCFTSDCKADPPPNLTLSHLEDFEDAVNEYCLEVDENLTEALFDYWSVWIPSFDDEAMYRYMNLQMLYIEYETHPNGGYDATCNNLMDVVDDFHIPLVISVDNGFTKAHQVLIGHEVQYTFEDENAKKWLDAASVWSDLVNTALMDAYQHKINGDLDDSWMSLESATFFAGKEQQCLSGVGTLGYWPMRAACDARLGNLRGGLDSLENRLTYLWENIVPEDPTIPFPDFPEIP